MSTLEEQQGTQRVLKFLQEWDRGDDAARSGVLNAFVAQNQGKTRYELERDFALGASLFLALTLRAVGVFLSASSNHQYILEFLEDGGVLTVLDILGQKRITEENRLEALRLLQTISTTSSKYREMICESQGVKVVAQCLAKSHSEGTQEAAQVLLETLAQGNPRYQPHVYHCLVGLLPSSPPAAQQHILRTLRTVQAEVKTAHPNILQPLLHTLRSQCYDVQDEAIGLILDLGQSELRAELLSGLVALLKGDQLHQMSEDPENTEMASSLPGLIQQAAAAKAIRLLAQSSEDASKELLSLRVVPCLLHALATREHKVAQIQASLSLMHFVQTYPDLTEQVQRGMGSSLFETFMQTPDKVYAHIDEIQAEMLLFNKVHQTRESEDGDGPQE